MDPYVYDEQDLLARGMRWAENSRREKAGGMVLQKNDAVVLAMADEIRRLTAMLPDKGTD